MSGHALQAAAHAVQLAITPVFLLSGIASLLSVFGSRLGRVSDQADALARQRKGVTRDTRLDSLRSRSIALDCAVVMATLAGTLTCGATLVLFLDGDRWQAAADALFVLFGGAIVLTLGALCAFVLEMLMAARGVREVVDSSVGDDVESHADRPTLV